MAKVNRQSIEKALQAKKIAQGSQEPAFQPTTPTGPEPTAIHSEANPKTVHPVVQPTTPTFQPKTPTGPEPVAIQSQAYKPEKPVVNSVKPPVANAPTVLVAPSTEKGRPVVAPSTKVVTPVNVPVVKSNFEEGYFRKLSCNYNDKGQWQREYVSWLERWFKIKGKQVLDVGCAMGAISSAMVDIGASVIGIDISAHAKHVSRFKNFTHIQGTAVAMPQILSESCDRVHVMSFFECLAHAEFELVLSEIKRVLKKGGIGFIVASREHISILESIAAKLGFENAIGKFMPEMQKHNPGWDFMTKHNWSVLVIERK